MSYFALGFHCHQPVGNFESVFEEIHKKSYSPLLRTLLKYESCEFCLHVSGILLEWWKKNDPDIIELIAKGVQANKIELLGGGYYEPILASIPYMDKIKQLDMTNKAFKKYFGVYPKGAWLTERVWQPDIIQALHEVGLGYTFLDDFQFFQAGIDKSSIDKIFMTEYNGKYIDIFPIHERLRYKMPFAEPEESIHEVLYLEDRLSTLSVMVDDGEKMGGWPNTYEWVYGKDGHIGWLDKFLMLAEGKLNNIQIKTPSKLLHIIKERKLTYLPFSSYREMGEWTLTPHKRFYYNIAREKTPGAPLCGGIWHNFFIRYPESNLIHKRMLFASNYLKESNLNFKKLNVDGYKSYNHSKAEKELLKSQANDAYWHGVFGGIYHPHLRRAIQNALIKSVVLIDKIKKNVPVIEKFDFDVDGEDEYQIRNNEWQILYKPSSSTILAWDYLRTGLINPLGDVFCLHNEYDIQIIKEKLNFASQNQSNTNSGDNNENIPHTIHDGINIPAGLSENDLITYDNILPSFQILYNGKVLNYKFKAIKKINKTVIIKTEGFLNGEVLIQINLSVGKILNYSFKLKNKKTGTFDILFRFSLPGGTGPSTYIRLNKTEVFGLTDEISKRSFDKKIIIGDSYWGAYLEGLVSYDTGCNENKKENNRQCLEFDNLPLFSYTPINTVSLSESGYEKIFQGGEIRLSLDINQIKTFNVGFSWQVKKI